MGFHDDEAFGNAGELRALQYLEYDRAVRAPKRRFKDWDFYTERNGKRTYWEVKTDRYTHRSGNIVIEYESSGEPSGITTTKADNWIYLLDGEPTMFIIPTEVLREAIASRRFHSIRRIAEQGKNAAYFFCRSLFEDYEYEVEVPACRV